MSAPLTARDVPFASNQPDAERLQRIAEGRYLFSASEYGTDIEVSHIREDRGERRARVKVYCGLAGVKTVNGVLFTSEITLTRFSGRRELTSALIDRTKIDRHNWASLVDEMVIRVEEAEATRTAVVDLSTVALPAPGATPYQVAGFWPLYLHDSNAIYAHGGSGKSLLATYAAGCLQRDGINTLIVDYEMTEDPQAARLASLFGAERPAVAHYRATRPLVHEADRLEAIIYERKIGFVVVDSAVPAASGNVNDADSARDYYATLRRLKVGSLTVAHVTKASQSRDSKPEDATPFGSAFWWNLARCAWHLRRSDQGDDPARLTLGLVHAKHNYGAKLPTIGLEILFHDGRARVRRIDAAEVPEFLGSVTIRERLRSLLKGGPREFDELCQEMPDKKPDSIRTTIARYSPGGNGKVVLFQPLRAGLVALANVGGLEDER